MYARQLTIAAVRQRVFDAIATVDGPRHWWTTLEPGSAAAGAELRFGFAGLDQQIVMRVDAGEPPSSDWSCVGHTRDEEWTGSRCGSSRRTRAAGVRARLPPHRDRLRWWRSGWEHFLASLAAYAERGAGNPYGVRRPASGREPSPWPGDGQRQSPAPSLRGMGRASPGRAAGPATRGRPPRPDATAATAMQRTRECRSDIIFVRAREVHRIRQQPPPRTCQPDLCLSAGPASNRLGYTDRRLRAPNWTVRLSRSVKPVGGPVS